jgi:hypothetical protein
VDGVVRQPGELLPAGRVHLLGLGLRAVRQRGDQGLRAASVGLLIAFYYGLTGFACVWFFRRDLLSSGRALLVKGILPLIGGLTLLGAFVLSIKSYWPAASSYSSFHGVGGIFLIGAGSLAVGVAMMFITARFLPRYFAEGITAPVETEGSSSS